MKKTLLMVMAALSMLFTQCRKTEPASPLAPAGDGQVSITLDVDGGNSKADVNTLSGVVTFKSGDVIYVASNGAYVGYLTYSDGTSRFEGTLTNPTEGQPLYFYFLGNKGPATANVATGATELTADISDQSDGLPVISGAASGRNYTSDVTGYSARLLNKCALVKFDVQNYDGEGMVSITGMNNKVRVDLGGNSFSYIADETNNGKITLNHKSGSEYWAILLPQDAVSGGTASFSDGWSGAFSDMPEIKCNAFLTNAIVIERYPVAGGETIEGSVASNGAVVKYTIIDYPGHTLKEHGVEYSTNADMSESTKVPYLNSSKADYFVALTELAAGTKYYARVYAEYDDGQKTVYGNQIDFTTLETPAYSCLCFTAEEANSTVSMNINGSLTPVPVLETSTDGNTWTAFTPGTTTITLANVGDKVYFRSKTKVSQFSTSSSNYAKFVMTGKIAASGSVMSLIDPDCQATEIPCEYCFTYLFGSCTSLTAAPELPATTLAKDCYDWMFFKCTSLTAAPALPAITLAEGCYYEMFRSCTLLTAAPALPAITLAETCYNCMFEGCSSLTAAPALPATTLTKSCYHSMFEDCTLLAAAPALPATTLAENCYFNMFNGCTSLTEAPALPATDLAVKCYGEMFYQCTSLTAAPALPATTLAENCYVNMFRGCTSLKTAPALPATTLAASCYQQMFAECTSLETAPALPATTLAKSCYQYMFYKCTSLETAPELKAETLAESCCAYMFRECIKLTAAPELFATALVTSCYSNMFYGCSKLNYIKVHFTAWDSTNKNTNQWVYGVAQEGDFHCPNALPHNATSANFNANRIPNTTNKKWTVTTF